MCLLQRVWLNCIPMYFQTIAFSKYDMLLLFVLFHQFNHPNACIDYILWCSWWCRPQLLVGNISTIWFLLWFSFIPATWVQMMGCEAHVRVDYVIHCNTFFPFCISCQIFAVKPLRQPLVQVFLEHIFPAMNWINLDPNLWHAKARRSRGMCPLR